MPAISSGKRGEGDYVYVALKDKPALCNPIYASACTAQNKLRNKRSGSSQGSRNTLEGAVLNDNLRGY